MQRLKLLVEYDGSPFHGWQRQSDQRSVQADLETALSTVLRETVKIRGAGRTDAGVHAVGQVVDLEVSGVPDLARLQWSLNALLRPSVAVKEIKVVSDEFDARRSAKLRVYGYYLLNRNHPSPLGARRYWWVAQSLDRRAMSDAGKCLVGRHDFSAFSVDGPGVVTTVKSIEWHDMEEPGLFCLRISADSFFHHMVRLIVGTLVYVGRGKISAAEFADILSAADVTRAGPLAPAHGLVLEEVRY